MLLIYGYFTVLQVRLGSNYKKVEQIVASVRKSGRAHYRNACRSMPVEPEMHFNVINHMHAGSSLVDNFPEWKYRLLERII